MMSPEKLDPIYLGDPNTRTKYIETVLREEVAARLQSIASEIGGFSVGIIAKAGDPYIPSMDNRSMHPHVISVPDGNVIVRMQNIANPDTPTNLSPLWRASESKR